MQAAAEVHALTPSCASQRSWQPPVWRTSSSLSASELMGLANPYSLHFSTLLLTGLLPWEPAVPRAAQRVVQEDLATLPPMGAQCKCGQVFLNDKLRDPWSRLFPAAVKLGDLRWLESSRCAPCLLHAFAPCRCT